jgi:hypothetical protein
MEEEYYNLTPPNKPRYMRQMGLRKMIYPEIQKNRYMTYREVEDLVRAWGFRTSNLERRLRPSECDAVKAVKSDKPPREIIGYRWISKEQPKIQIQTFPQIAMKL